MTAWRTTWLMGLLWLAAWACADSSGVDLIIRYDDATGIAKLHLMALDKDSLIDPTHYVRVETPSSWVGADVTLRIFGLDANRQRVLSGTTTFSLRPDKVTQVEVSLTPMACDAGCIEGSTLCEGNGVRTCRREGNCTVWSDVVPCPTATPSCSLGVCKATCEDECRLGQTRCLGTGHRQTCGYSDDDPCLDWSLPITCPTGSRCDPNSNACTTTCLNECAPSTRKCDGNAVVNCSDRNNDGCYEWGPPISCASGSCTANTCLPVCVDQCTRSSCTGTTFQACANINSDACLELAPPQACGTMDRCKVPRCTNTGCDSTDIVCDQPPATTCFDANTRRTFVSNGICSSEQGCQYPYLDHPCPNGCSLGRCRAAGCGETCEPTTLARHDTHPFTLRTTADEQTLYYAADGNVYQIPLTGGSAQTLYTSDDHIRQLTLDGDYLYWSYDHKIVRLHKRTREQTSVLTGHGAIFAVTNGVIAWGGATGDGLRVRHPDGRVAIIDHNHSVDDIVMSATHVYWIASGAVFQAPLGGGPSTLLLANHASWELALHDNALYISATDGIIKLALDGSGMRHITTERSRSSFALDAQRLCYLANDLACVDLASQRVTRMPTTLVHLTGIRQGALIGVAAATLERVSVCGCGL